jgi:hypothetical protein
MSSSAYSDCSLYLQPSTTDAIASDRLVDALRETGLAGDALDATQDQRYLTGENYLELINYLGCSPTITFKPDTNDQRFCHISIHQFDTPRLIQCQSQPKKPQCPCCQRPVSSWTYDAAPDTPTITCDNCHTETATEAYNWRKSAGYARSFIEITDVFPREAVPQPSLLDKLETATGISWHYFYACR